jgi:16S rRNA (adenine1518-N6/adenine1519-N6)-dimethyltransferase
VESTVVVMERRARLPVDVGDPKAFRGVVRALFAQRRKMARRALTSICADPVALLEAAGVEATRRGETFDLAELAAISRAWVRLRQRD